MQGPYSRRHWMLSAAVIVAGVKHSFAEPPAMQQAVRRDSFPSRSIEIEPTIRRTNSTVVTAIAADPRGEFLAVAGDDFSIRLFDIATFNQAYALEGHRDLIRTIAFDPLGNSLVSAGNDGQLIVWDRTQQFTVSQRMIDTPALACVRFAPNRNEMAAVGFNQRVFIIGHSAGRAPQFNCDCNDLRAVAYRDDSKLLAVGGRSGELHLFNPVTGELVAEARIHDARIRDIAFHRDANAVISVGEDGRVVVYDSEKHEVIHRVEVTTGRLFAIAVLDSQHVAVAGSENSILIVNTDDGTVRHTLEGHVGSVSTLAAYGGMLFSGGFDATLRRWSLDDLTRSDRRIADGDIRIER